LLDVQVDGRPWEGAANDWKNADDLFDAVERDVLDGGRCVIAVERNGARLAEDELGDLCDVIPAEGERWSFVTRERGAVVTDAIASALDFAGQIERLLAEIVRDLRMGDPADGLERWMECLDGLVVVSNVTGMLASEIGDRGPALARTADTLRAVLGEIEASQVEEDWIYMADLLETRLARTVGAWRDELAGAAAEPAKAA